DEHWNEEGRHAGWPLLHKTPVLLLERRDPADAAAHDDPEHLRLDRAEILVQPGFAHRLNRGSDGELRVAIRPLGLLPVDVLARIELLHLPREAHGVFGRVEAGDRVHAATTLEKGRPA